ncbi:Bromodomain-containing protein [Scheffersomyces xylosifermentans]|uniref:Bromodomain-containing protein n=1 Tax=Scheffersomyces xylosifermentans TaxID=1304137 RepID=UPI00315C55C2
MVSKRKSVGTSPTSHKKVKVVTDISHTPEEFKKFYTSTIQLVLDLKDETTDDQLAFPFIKVPSKKLYPDYYDIIAEPIALTDIQKKALKGKYSDSSADGFLADFKLLLDNAAKYNDPESWIVSGATQIYDFVKEQIEEFETSPPAAPEHPKLKLKLKEPTEVKKESAAPRTPRSHHKAAAPADDDSITFGKLPEICTKLLNDVIEHDFPDEGIISSPYMEDVDLEEYPDYITYVEKPMSFNTVLSLLNGKKLFGPRLSVADNLQKFYDTTTLIFTNAMTYNDPSSEIYQDAEKLKVVFDEKYDALKAKVEGHSHGSKSKARTNKPKLKLSLHAPASPEPTTEEVKTPKKRGRKKKIIEPEVKAEEEDEEEDDVNDSELLPKEEEPEPEPETKPKVVIETDKFTPNTLGKTLPTIPKGDSIIQESSISSSIAAVGNITQHIQQKAQPNVPLQRHQDLKKALFPTHQIGSVTSIFDYRVPSNGYAVQSYTVTLPPDVSPFVTFKASLHNILYDIKSDDLIDGRGYLNSTSDEDFQCKLYLNDEEVSNGGDCFEEKKEQLDLLAVQYDLKLNYGLNYLSFECKVAPPLSKKMKSTVVEDDEEEVSSRHTRHQLQQLKMSWDVETISFYVICNST